MYLTWSSDGSALYYMTYFEDQRYLNRTDVRTGITDTLLVEPPDEAPKAALITPDGSRAVISRNYPQGPADMPRGLVVKDLETGAETVLSSDAPQSLGISPDGSVLSVLVDDPDLGVRRLLLQPLDGGPATVLAEFDGSEGGINRISGLDWTPDGRFILASYFTPAAEGEWDNQYLAAFPVDGGDPMRLGQISSAWAKPSLHPDGRRLIYVDGDEKAEVWVMEGWR
jgi:Tol biopolymer transport system component